MTVSGRSQTIVAFASAKGGSGKTITCSSIGRLLASMGYQTLLVDADAATNGLTLMCLPSVTKAKSSDSAQKKFGLFETEENEKMHAIELGENLALLPATYKMLDTEIYPVEKFENAARRLKQEFQDYDFILIDAQSGIDRFARACVEIADQCVIVSEYDPASVEGIERLRIIFSPALRTERTWVLFNKILPEFANAIGHGLVVARYLPPIVWNADVVRAVVTGESPLNLETPNDYSISIAQALRRFSDIGIRNSLEAWFARKRLSITSPLQERLHNLNERLEVMVREEIDLTQSIESARNSSRVYMYVSLAAIVSVLFMALNSILRATANREQGSLFFDTDTVLALALAFAVVAIGTIMGARINRSVTNRLLQRELLAVARKDLDEERQKVRGAADAAAAALRLDREYSV